MRFYFLSSSPCALKLSGAYFGTVNDFERFIDLTPKDNIFAEFIPCGAQPVCFFINENIRFCPPENCEVYLLPNAVAIYVKRFPPSDSVLRPHVQKTFEDTLITVFSQGEVQVSLQSPLGFFVRSLPPCFANCELFFHGGLFFLETPNRLLALTKTGDLVLEEQVLEYSFQGDSLTAVLPLLDSRKSRAKVEYQLFETGVNRTEFSLLLSPQEDGSSPHGLLAYAFFESVLIGSDYSRFLGEELKSKSTFVKKFLGAFEAVLPTEKENVCHLVYKKSERLYEVKPFTVEIQEGKITDLKG